jgi:hypothetical protein
MTEDYSKFYKRSIQDPEAFWGEAAQDIDWFKPFDKGSGDASGTAF